MSFDQRVTVEPRRRNPAETADLLAASGAGLLEALLEGLNDVVAIISPDFRILSVNPSCREIFEEKHPEGKSCFQVFRGLGRPCHPCPARSAMESGEVCRHVADIGPGDSGRHFEVTASPLRGPDGDTTAVVLLKRDLTSQKHYAAISCRSERMATLGALAAGVAHELNNPLTSIIGFAEGLKRRLLKLKGRADEEALEDIRDYVDIIFKESHRCRDIVQNLLSFSRQAASEFTAVDLNRVIAETIKLLHNHLKRYPRGVIHLDPEENLPDVPGNPSDLKQVVLNLLLNALDAVQSGGTVTVSTFVNCSGNVGVAVEDTGCGISAEDLKKVFVPFFTTKPAGKGIGIGLSTCRDIVQGHGGKISVCSQEGFGSSFVVVLPCQRSSINHQPEGT